MGAGEGRAGQGRGRKGDSEYVVCGSCRTHQTASVFVLFCVPVNGLSRSKVTV